MSVAVMISEQFLHQQKHLKPIKNDEKRIHIAGEAVAINIHNLIKHKIRLQTTQNTILPNDVDVHFVLADIVFSGCTNAIKLMLIHLTYY